jgi:hypothetical protein
MSKVTTTETSVEVAAYRARSAELIAASADLVDSAFTGKVDGAAFDRLGVEIAAHKAWAEQLIAAGYDVIGI